MEAPANERIAIERETSHSIGRLLDYGEVQNLMSTRAYYERAAQNEFELALFSSRSDVSWGENNGFWVGIGSIRRYRLEWAKLKRSRDLVVTKNRFPEIDSRPENVGSGSFAMHTLTTPVIEIAGDRETAKAMWYSPGIVIEASLSSASGFVAYWSWQKYAVDFVREERQWRFWHLSVYTDWRTEFSTSPVSASLKIPDDTRTVDLEAKKVANASLRDMRTPDIRHEIYNAWFPGRVPRMHPEPPVPYETFSQTCSYGPDGISG